MPVRCNRPRVEPTELSPLAQMFYHCFPRQRVADRRASVEQVAKGLAILRSIAEFGLLLSPETANSNRTRPSCRACFTLSSRDALTAPIERVVGGRDKLLSHTDLFGAFAIGIGQESARLLGLQPVVYHYRSERADSLSEKIHDKIEEIRALLGVLAYLEASVGDEEKFHTTDTLHDSGYLSPNAENAVRMVATLSAEARREFFEVITEIPRSTSWNLIDWLDHFRDHFQTVDGRSQIGTLSYYMQNEWRVGRMQFGDREVIGLEDASHPAIAEVREMLSAIDRGFFTPSVLSECALLATAQNRYFFDHVTEVICPRAAADDVAAILGETDPGRFLRTGGRFAAMSVFERTAIGSTHTR